MVLMGHDFRYTDLYAYLHICDIVELLKIDGPAIGPDGGLRIGLNLYVNLNNTTVFPVVFLCASCCFLGPARCVQTTSGLNIQSQ